MAEEVRLAGGGRGHVGGGLVAETGCRRAGGRRQADNSSLSTVRSGLRTVDGAGADRTRWETAVAQRGRLAPARVSDQYQWCVHEMLRQEPALQLARADHLGHQEVVRPVVTHLRGAGRRVMTGGQDDLVRLQQP